MFNLLFVNFVAKPTKTRHSFSNTIKKTPSYLVTLQNVNNLCHKALDFCFVKKQRSIGYLYIINWVKQVPSTEFCTWRKFKSTLKILYIASITFNVTLASWLLAYVKILPQSLRLLLVYRLRLLININKEKSCRKGVQ